MRPIDLKIGDSVHYRDRDANTWGPWQVTDLGDTKVTVRVDGVVTCTFDTAALNIAPAVILL